jgi:hypothetical protein
MLKRYSKEAVVDMLLTVAETVESYAELNRELIRQIAVYQRQTTHARTVYEMFVKMSQKQIEAANKELERVRATQLNWGLEIDKHLKRVQRAKRLSKPKKSTRSPKSKS